MQQVLPQFDGTHPYQQITFQYSLHYIEHEGGELKHTAFLAPSNGTDPRRALAEALCHDIPMNSCIMAYNDPFEKGRITEMAEAYPDLAAHLINLHGNIIDLLIPFRDGNCYRPAMGGSFSIKSVLPALFPDDDELNYHNLNPLVQNGGHAMTIFPKIKDIVGQRGRRSTPSIACLLPPRHPRYGARVGKVVGSGEVIKKSPHFLNFSLCVSILWYNQLKIGRYYGIKN